MEQDRAAVVHALRVSEQILSLVHEHTEHIEQLRPGTRHSLDLRQVPRLNGLEAATLLRLVQHGKSRGVTVQFTGVRQQAHQAFIGLDLGLLDPPEPARGRLSLLESIGDHTLTAVATGRRIIEMIGELAYWLCLAPWRGKGIKWDRTREQIVKIGVDGIPIVTFLSFLIGAVLALNAASQLRQFGAAIYIANLVAVSMTREMAPLITAIIVAGRSGSAITAELGTMVVSEEIDAMRTMALSPGRFFAAAAYAGPAVRRAKSDHTLKCDRHFRGVLDRRSGPWTWQSELSPANRPGPADERSGHRYDKKPGLRRSDRFGRLLPGLLCARRSRRRGDEYHGLRRGLHCAVHSGGCRLYHDLFLSFLTNSESA